MPPLYPLHGHGSLCQPLGWTPSGTLKNVEFYHVNRFKPSLTKAKPRFIYVQHMCVHLRLCIFHHWQLPKRVLWWYTVSNGDQQHKYNSHIPYFKHGQTTFHRCVHETTSLVIQTLTITKRRFIDLHNNESLRLPMEVTHDKQINTISKSPTVVIHPWHYPRHALFILTILSKGPQQKQMIYKH